MKGCVLKRKGKRIGDHSGRGGRGGRGEGGGGGEKSKARLTWNISPAPSQSLVVMIGVCTYRNPADWKNSCVAKARALRIRATAPMVFVRGRKWAFSLNASSVCFFLAIGYLPALLSQGPRCRMRDALSSIACGK